MKPIILLLIVAATGLFSCEQSSKPKTDPVESETFNSTRRYEYADASGKRVTITNSLPKGTPYTAPDGTNYFRVIYWSGITNETENPLEMSIGFSSELYEIPGLSGSHYKILIPPDTMSVDKETSGDYGITDLKYFLDHNIDKSSSIIRTIQPHESTGFYVVLLGQTTETKPNGTMRTGLNIRGQNLVYTISRYANQPGHPLLSKKEINCGSINLIDLVLQKETE